MSGVERITGPLLDVLEVLVQAHTNNSEVHGWELMRTTKRAGPTIYRVLDRLEDAQWVTARWEETNPDPSRPRRRLYQLSPTGLAQANATLAERRPSVSPQASGGTGRLIPGPAFGRLTAWWSPSRSVRRGGAA